MTNNSLNDFCKRFKARYQDCEMPLLEVLDPNVGIGYSVLSDTVPNPLADGFVLPRRQVMQGPIINCPLYKLLEQKLFEFNSYEKDRIEITDEDVADFNSVEDHLPLSVAAVFSIVDHDCKRDEYRLQGLHFNGASAGNLLGRFTGGDKEIETIVKTVSETEQKLASDALIAELAHLPEVRTGNILHRKHIRDYEITYLTGCDLDEEHIIPANDLLVRVNVNRVVLRSKRLNKQIIPRLTTAHNYSRNGTPFYKFLCDLQSQGKVPSLYFSWCGLENIHRFLPRVVYKNVILSPARWRIDIRSIDFRGKMFDLQRVKRWKSVYRLPDEVLLISGDNKLYINLTLEYSVKAMLSEINNNLQQIVLEEFIPCRNVAVDKSRNNYNNECIIPFVRRH